MALCVREELNGVGTLTPRRSRQLIGPLQSTQHSRRHLDQLAPSILGFVATTDPWLARSCVAPRRMLSIGL